MLFLIIFNFKKKNNTHIHTNRTKQTSLDNNKRIYRLLKFVFQAELIRLDGLNYLMYYNNYIYIKDMTFEQF